MSFCKPLGLPLASACLFVFAGCQETPPTNLALNLDPCIAKVEITLTQSGTTITQSASNPGSMGFEGFNWSKDIAVKIVVTEMKPECESQVAKGDTYYFNSVIPSTGGKFTLAATDLPNVYRPTDVAKAGTVYAGWCDVRSIGPGIALGVDLKTTAGNCTKSCWQQWIKPRLVWLDTGTPKEIMAGKLFSDPAGGTPHTYGKFDRDLPTGSVGNCFREDAIPGKPASKGIVDAPAYRPTAEQVKDLFGQLGLAIRQVAGHAVDLPYDLRFEFTVVSVLWCEDAPASILGYYTWTSHQDYALAAKPGANPPWAATGGNSVIDNFEWHAETAGLDPSMQVH